MRVITKSSEETEAIGEKFASKLQPKDIVFLIGNLGSGKTTFTKGIAKGLGITSRILSPTFVVVRSYKINDNKISMLYHLDLYRLSNEKEALDINLTDYIADERGVVVIEWPEISQNLVKGKVWKVVINNLGDAREVNIFKE